MLGRWPFGSRAKAVRNSPGNGDVIKKRKKRERKKGEGKKGEKILCASSGPRSRTGERPLRFRAKGVFREERRNSWTAASQPPGTDGGKKRLNSDNGA